MTVGLEQVFRYALAASLIVCVSGCGSRNIESSSIAEPASVGKQHHISIEELRTMFDGMRTKSHWKVDGPMLWGYFFFDHDRAKLENLGKELVKDGYRLVEVGPREGGEYCLHVEKVEKHTPETLNARNESFEKLADRRGIESYDGMDVGPAPNQP